MAVNDPLLEPLLRAPDEAARERELERLFGAVAPLIERVLSRYSRSEGPIRRADAEDLTATVNLRLMARLRAVCRSPEEAVASLEDYVATLTYNTVHDYFRRRYPERARLKNRLRYVLTHDPRLALWTTAGGAVAGLAEWRDRPAGAATLGAATTAMRDRDRPADALVALFRATGAPWPLDALIDKIAELWGVSDAAVPARVEAEPARGVAQLETRDFLRVLWREIRQLPAPQRKALLLNLRDSETVNVVALLATTGIAGFDELAAVLEMSVEELAAIWNDLPLDDLRTASMLGLSRQQVINLRKAARRRLARRMATGNR